MPPAGIGACHRDDYELQSGIGSDARMHITRITVFHRDLPLYKPYRLPGDRPLVDSLDSTILRLDTDAGLTGWAEGCPWGPTYGASHGRGTRAGIAELAPVVLGRDPRQLDTLGDAMDRALLGHHHAKSPLDIACWDILGQATGLPLHTLLGGRATARVPIASSIPIDSPAAMLDTIERYRGLGCRLHSAKIGSDHAADVDRIRRLTAAMQPGEVSFFDVNRAWQPHQGAAVMNAVRDLPVFFEQPCATLDQCLQLRRLTCHPVSIDENLETLPDLLRVQRDGIGEIVNIKINRVGGLTKARRLRDVALAAGMGVLVMETGGTVLADTATAHLACTVPPGAIIGSWACQDLLTVDSAAPDQGARNVDGHLSAPDRPGLGCVPDADRLGPPVAVYEI